MVIKLAHAKRMINPDGINQSLKAVKIMPNQVMTFFNAMHIASIIGLPPLALIASLR